MTFKEIRAKLNDAQNKLNKANNIVCQQIDEIAVLNKLIDVQSNQIKCIRKELDIEHTQKTNLENRLKIKRRSMNRFFSKWSNEKAKNNMLKAALYVSAIANVFIVAILCVELVK